MNGMKWLLLIFLLLLSGCSVLSSEKPQDQILEVVWSDLSPYTQSHERANWQVKESAQKRGELVMKEFEGKPFSCIRPQPPANQTIQASRSYWYVVMAPKPATPAAPRLSPTAPPAVPEPFLYQAVYLVEPTSGQIIARKLSCVIY